MECKNLAQCPFFNCCDELQKNTSVAGFMTLYCKGDKMSSCVRLRLSDQFGKQVIPKNMMPNGLPVPGTNCDGWSPEALDYRTVLK
jgi:hypothetical protein